MDKKQHITLNKKEILQKAWVHQTGIPMYRQLKSLLERSADKCTGVETFNGEVIEAIR